MIVNEKLRQYTKKHNFRFAQWHKMVVGGIIKKKFLKTYPGHALPIVKSVESAGTFMVFDYPDNFCERMEVIISDYVDLVKEQKAKRISEAQAKKTTQNNPQKLTKPTLEKKQRKRIPLNKPTFSGNKFK